MFHRVLVLAIGFTFCTSLCSAQFGTSPFPTSRDRSLPSHFAGGNASLEGTVTSAMTSKPLQSARVELRDINNGTVVGSAYTNSAGQFDFGAVPSGLYQVVAIQGIGQAEERVDVSSFRTTVNLRVPVSDAPADGADANRISVAQYRVPEKARNEFRKAEQASTKSNMQEALTHVSRALEIYPNYADALTLRAILNLAGNTTAAISDLEKAIQADGNYALAYTVLGSALNAQAKFDDAIKTLQRGESLAPNVWQSYFEMARAYLGKMDYQSALAQIEKAQSLIPSEYPPLRLVRAQAFMALKQYRAVIEDCQAYLQKDSTGPNAQTAQQMLQQAKQFEKD